MKEEERLILKEKVMEDLQKSEYFDLLMDNTVEETQKILVNIYGAKK